MPFQFCVLLRNITGSGYTIGIEYKTGTTISSGALKLSQSTKRTSNGGHDADSPGVDWAIDLEGVVPTADEDRPKNFSSIPIIRAA